jgi:glycosyltransferase involved in cell wall biosynthesis
LNIDLFDDYIRAPETSQQVRKLKDHLKEHLHRYLRSFDLDLLIVENALSLPMNVPLALALTELIAETCIPTIAHHHDFSWERRRYAVSAADDYLRAAFPPTLSSIHHVVINSFAGRQLALRSGASSTLIPNVMGFDAPPPQPDEYAADLRSALGIPSDAYLILQPTRIVPRKRIEHAIELVRRLDVEGFIVISHSSGDEGTAYGNYLQNYANLIGVKVLFSSDVIAHTRAQQPDGRKIYSLADVYQKADLVTYPSTIEGFGNAFLETIYYRRPIMLSIYEIFKTDIQPKGFKVIGFEDFITDSCVERAREALTNQDLVTEMVEHNYELGRRHYSYRVLENRLVVLVNQCMGI